jgi:hypothetical protein
MKRALAVVCGVLLMTAMAAAQRGGARNFAGTWYFDQTATTASAAEAKMAAGPIFGEAFNATQTPTSLTLHITAGTLNVTAVYALDGSVSKNTSPPAMPGTAPIDIASVAKWDGDRLLITSTSQSPSANGPVDVKSVRTMWLDAQGRLVIERTGTPETVVASSRSVYKKRM